MSVTAKIQSSFTSGELDPRLRARNDIAVYYSGATKLRNVMAIPQGGVIRRPGLEYIDFDVPSGNTRLISFVFSDELHYLIVLSTNLVQVLRDGIVVEEIACTITNTQVKECTWAQLNDVLLLFHHDFAPKAFIRNSETSWSTEAWAITNAPTYPVTMTPTTTEITITDQAGTDPVDFTDWTNWFGNYQFTTITAGAAAFTAGDVGNTVRGSFGGYATITEFISTTVVKATVVAPFSNELGDGDAATQAGDWWIESPCWTSTRGYPSCGCFFQGRLYMAGTKYQPTGVWGSVVNNEHNFQNWMPSYDDNGIFFVARGTQTPIHHIFGGDSLMLVSSEALFYVSTGIDAGPITPTTVSVHKVDGSDGASPALYPFSVSGSLMYMRQGGKAIIEATYNSMNSNFQFINLNLLASHLLNNPVDLAYRRQTSTDEADYVLVVNGDGTLSTLCTLREQEINAWTVIETEGQFKHVGIDGSDMYFIVKRYIDGQPKNYLEKFNSDLYVDSGRINPGVLLTYGGTQLTYDIYDLSYNYPDFTSVRGFEHLSGQFIKVLLDGTLQPDILVDGDSITLARAGDDIQAGLSFPIVDSDTGSHVFVESMPLEIEGPWGSSVDRKKRLLEVTAMVDNTSQLTICKNSVPMRRLDVDTLDSPIPVQSGNVTVKGILGWDTQMYVSIGQTLPLPFTLLGMAYRVKV